MHEVCIKIEPSSNLPEHYWLPFELWARHSAAGLAVVVRAQSRSACSPMVQMVQMAEISEMCATKTSELSIGY
jgi:hypothetical protein